MKFGLSPAQRLVFVLAALVIVIAAVFPTFGAPHFRYTGSGPGHHVWNLGWPLSTCIYDGENPPHFFVGPMAYVYLFVGIPSFAVLYVAVIAWNIRGLILARRHPPGLHSN